MTKKLMDKILYISFALIVLFAWADSENIIGVKQINTPEIWDAWFGQMLPANFIVWIGVLAAIGLIWYLYSKDKSEALALFLTPATLIIFGVQDLIYYIISPDIFSESIGCWADALSPVRYISDALGESCPTATSFFISAVMGALIAYRLYNYLKEAKW